MFVVYRLLPKDMPIFQKNLPFYNSLHGVYVFIIFHFIRLLFKVVELFLDVLEVVFSAYKVRRKHFIVLSHFAFFHHLYIV